MNALENIVWFRPNKLIEYLFYALLSCLALCGVFVLFLIIKSGNGFSYEQLHKLLFFTIYILNIALLMAFIVYYSTSKTLGRAGRLFLIRDHNDETVIKPYNQIYKVGNRGLLIDDIYFNLGNKKKVLLIDKQEYQAHIEPALDKMLKMSEWEYFKYRITNMNQEWRTLSGLLSLLLILSAYGYWLFDLNIDLSSLF